MRPAEVAGMQVHPLDRGTGGAIEHYDAPREEAAEDFDSFSGIGAIGHQHISAAQARPSRIIRVSDRCKCRNLGSRANKREIDEFCASSGFSIRIGLPLRFAQLVVIVKSFL